MEADMREQTAEPGGITDRTLYQHLEALAAAFPWDGVAIWIEREPEGIYSFVVQVKGNSQTGAEAIFEVGNVLEEIVNNAMKQAPSHDPELAREKRIAELQMQLARLKNRTYGLPPYRAPNQLGFGERKDQPLPVPFINIESEGRPF